MTQRKKTDRPGLYEKCFAEIENLDLLSEDGIIVAEHDSRTELPHNTSRLTMLQRDRKSVV